MPLDACLDKACLHDAKPDALKTSNLGMLAIVCPNSERINLTVIPVSHCC